MGMRDFYLVKRLRDLIALSPKVRQFIVRLTGLALFFEILKLLPPFFFKEIIDRLVTYDPAVGLTFELVLVLVLGYAASLLFMTLFDVVFQRVLDRNIRDAEVDVASRTVRKLLSLDLRYHEAHGTGVSANKILKGQTKLFDLMFNLMYILFPVTFQTIVTLAILFWFSWEIGLLFLVFVPLFVYLLIRGARITQASRNEYHAHYDQFAGTIVQSLSNIRTVKDFHAEDKEVRKADTQLGNYSKAISQRITLGLGNSLRQSIISDIARLATLAIAVWLMIDGRITAGSLVLIMTLSEKAYINLERLWRTYHTMQDAEPSIDRFNDIYRAQPAVQDVRSSARITKGKVEFRDVSFRYEQGRSHALRNVSFTVEPRQTAAFVGRSGSGKSTLVKLLVRHFDVDRGEVLIDGRSVKEYSLGELRGAIGIVSQDVELFNDTVFENIAYGVQRPSRADVIKAAKAANAHGFITGLPQGYDTVVGERGVKLSGGQKQRIAIARALLRRPRILVFDEATSSLDSESEQLIHESIRKLAGKLTLIIIAHRFSTIESADRIVLLDSGEVKEIGTHEELLRRKGIFARLRRLQQLGEME